MKTGLTKKQKVTELYYNAKDPIKKLTLPEVNELMETILCLPSVQQAIQSAIQNHDKEEPPIGTVSSECHTD